VTSSQGGQARFPSFGMGAQVIALLLVLGLVSAMAIQPTRELLAQEHRIAATARELHRTESANHRLDSRIARLRNPDFIEEQARAEIGLVRPGEIAYVVMPKAKNEHKAHEANRRQKGSSGKRAHAARSKLRQAKRETGLIRGFLTFLGL
jgi:cell division protein FtsB